MNIRSKAGGLVVSSVLAVTTGCSDVTGDPEVGAPIVRTEAAISSQDPFAYQIPTFTGQRYTDSVPDTLELPVMAGATLETMTKNTDAERNYAFWFLTDWQHRPARLTHEGETNDEGDFSGDRQSQGKFMAPLVWNRMVSGSNFNLNLQRAILDGYLGDVNGTHATTGSSARSHEGFIVNYLRDDNPMWKTVVLQAAQGWVEALVDNGDWGYWQVDEHDPFGGDFDAQDPWREEVLLLAYKHLGYARGLATVKKHVNWARRHSGFFDEAGHFPDNHNGHFHVHALYLQSFLTLALLVKDQDLLDFVHRSYQWAKSPEAHSLGVIGFFPEFVDQPRNSEGCNLADMVTLAIELSKAGVADYWDDADRWIRNHYAEAQLTPAFAAQLDADNLENGDDSEPPNPLKSTTERVSERSIGSFAGWPAVNDWRHRDQRGIQQCCTGNGARSVFHAWSNVLSEGGGVFRVNLLLNRASARADVYSHLPYVGRVDVKMKLATPDVRIRIPGWVSTSGLQLRVNGNVRSLVWDGRYLRVGATAAGDVIRVTFTQSESTVSETFAGTRYTFTRRGSTVVSVSPRGEIAPLYERSRYRSSPAPMKSVSRFVSNEANVMTRVDPTWKLPVVRVTATSDDGHGPENMLDGDQGDESRWSAEGDGESATFELNREYTLDYVNASLFQGEDRLQFFEVQVSRNGRDFTTVFDGRSSGITTALHAFDCQDARARFVRLVGHGNSEPAEWNEFTEFEIFGTEAAPPAVLSIPSSAVSASGHDGNPPRNVVDGQLSTRWSVRGDGQWIRFDLGALKSVAALDVAFHQGSSRVQRFDIEVSNDGDDWTLVWSGQSSGTTLALEPFEFPNMAARYARIVGHGSSTSNLVALTEVRVRGY